MKNQIFENRLCPELFNRFWDIEQISSVIIERCHEATARLNAVDY